MVIGCRLCLEPRLQLPGRKWKIDVAEIKIEVRVFQKSGILRSCILTTRLYTGNHASNQHKGPGKLIHLSKNLIFQFGVGIVSMFMAN